MANTYVLYTGNGSTKNYSVPFPFILSTHVQVLLNGVLQLTPADYVLTGTTVAFVTAPDTDASIEISRETPDTTRLVDFENGAVLTESDLDTAFTQNFYLIQEIKENYDILINDELQRVGSAQGVTATDSDTIIAGLIDTMLADAAAASLLAARTDIDTNAETILDIETRTVDAEAAITAEAITRAADDAAEAALRVALAARVTTAEGDISSASVLISANASAITDTETDITSLMAHYGVTLNVDGYITGFAQNNDGTTGSFVVLADKFAIITPSTVWQAATAYTLGQMVRPVASNGRVFECTTAGTSGGSEPTWDTTISNTTADNTAVWTCLDDLYYSPFTVSEGVVTMQDVTINGTLLVNGTVVGAHIADNSIDTDHLQANSVIASKINAGEITAAKMNVTQLAAITADLGAITAGNITLDSSGYIKGGQTAFDTGTGFFLGYDTSAYKFSLGNASTKGLSWDGSTLLIRGTVYSRREVGDDVLHGMGTNRNTTTTPGWEQLKEFSVAQPGEYRLTLDVFRDPYVSGTISQHVQYRILEGGVVLYTSGNITAEDPSRDSGSHDLELDPVNGTVTLEMRCAELDTTNLRGWVDVWYCKYATPYADAIITN